MNAKTYFAATIILSAVLLALAATQRQTKRGDKEPGTALTGPSGKFGPIIDAFLPAARTNGDIDILNLETGRILTQPPLDFNSRADTIMGWIRSNGLDLSCSTWPASAACVTHDMAIIAINDKPWEETTEEELLDNPVLAAGRHHPRRLLVLGNDRPNTYLFRTGEGTLGMLQIAGVAQREQGVKIRYKLVNPASHQNSIAVR